MASGRSWSRRFGRRARAAATRVATTASFCKRCTFSRFTTSPGGPCRRSLAIGTDLEAVLAAEPARRVRGDAGDFGRNERHRAPRPDGRFDGRARPCLGGRGKRGQQSQALGRSRGGFFTKIHLKTDFDGLPLAFHLTGREASHSPHFALLLDIGPAVTHPARSPTDRGAQPHPRWTHP